MKPVDVDACREEALTTLRECCIEVNGVPVVSIIATIGDHGLSYSVSGPDQMTDDAVRAVLLFAARKMAREGGSSHDGR